MLSMEQVAGWVKRWVDSLFLRKVGAQTYTGDLTINGTLNGVSLANYALLPGRAGGQHLRGGTAASNNLTLESTSHATKGNVIIQPNGGNVGIATSDIKAWASTHRAIQIGRASSIMASSSTAGEEHISLHANAYYDGTWKRYLAETSSLLEMNRGTFALLSGNTGTAGGAITWTTGLRINSNGQVSIGRSHHTRSNVRLLIANPSGWAALHIQDGVADLSASRISIGANSGGVNWIESYRDQETAKLMPLSIDAEYLLFKTGPGSTSIERMYIGSNGNVGIGTSSPQGLLHGHDGTGGFLFVTKTGVAGTAVTIIPDGTGDVLYSVRVQYTIRGSGGLATGGNTTLTPGNTSIIYSNGPDTVELSCSAGGALTVQRITGSLTYITSFLLNWT